MSIGLSTFLALICIILGIFFMNMNITPALLKKVIEEEKDYNRILARLDVSHSTFYNYLNKDNYAEVKKIWATYSRRSLPIIPNDLLIEKLEEFFGNMYAVSDYFGVTRASLYSRVDKEEDIKAAFTSARASWGDFLLRKLHNKVEADEHRSYLFAALNHEVSIMNLKLKEKMLEAGLPDDAEQLTLTAVPRSRE